MFGNPGTKTVPAQNMFGTQERKPRVAVPNIMSPPPPDPGAGGE